MGVVDVYFWPGGGGADAGVTGCVGGDDGDVDAAGLIVVGQEADDLLGQVLVTGDGGGVGLGACGPAAKTTRARQAARTAQAQRGRRPRGRMGDVGLACGDGGWGRGIGEVTVLMEPGCPGDLTGTIQPASQLMSGWPDKRMTVREKVRSAGQRGEPRPDLGEPGQR